MDTVICGLESGEAGAEPPTLWFTDNYPTHWATVTLKKNHYVLRNNEFDLWNTRNLMHVYTYLI